MNNTWQTKTLGEICKISTGKSNTEDAIENGEFAFFDRSKIIKKSSKYLFDCDAIIVAGEGQAFLPKFYSGKFDLHQRAYAIYDFDKRVCVHFVYKYLIHFHKYFEKVAVGTTAKSLRLRHFQELPIPIPSFSEQQRIVFILNKSFSALEKAKEAAEKNLQNAREMFESYLQKVFKNKGEGWEEKMLGEIADIEYGYTDKSTEEGMYRYIRITDIDKNGELILNDKKYIKYSKDIEKFIINNKDLLMARTGATFAKVLLFNGNEPSVFASYLIRIKFKIKIENELYWYFTKTRNYWKQANLLQSGSAQPHFNGTAVKQIIFTYPISINEQKRLVEKLQKLSDETKKLEGVYQTKISKLDELKKSLLQKAFAGELTRKQ